MQNADALGLWRGLETARYGAVLYEGLAEHSVVFPVSIQLVASHPSGGVGGEARDALPVDGRQGI